MHGGMGDWRADINLRVELLLPFGLALVRGGNHSLTYDGLSMVRRYDGCALWEVVDEVLGVLFEIGRLMLEQGVRYDAPIAEDTEVEGDENDRFPIGYRVFFDGADTVYSLSDSGATI